MNAQARPAASERLRLLAIMGVDVYVPRDSPLANAADVSPVSQLPSEAPSMSAARVRISCVGADSRLPLLAAVLRGVRLQREDWTLAGELAGALPEWRFGESAVGAPPPAVSLPSLAALRDSVSVRRDTWHLLRAWLRSA